MATIPTNMRNVLIDAINDGFLNIRLEQTASGTEHSALSALDADDHPQYLTEARGDARYYTENEIDTLSGTLQDGIDSIIPNLIEEIVGEAYPAGVENLPAATDTITVNFSQPLDDPNYNIIMSMENTVDVTPSTYTYLVSAKTANGFTITLSAPTDTENYKMNWITGPVSSLLANPDHSQQENLDYDSSGHTGFVSTAALATTSGVLQDQIDTLAGGIYWGGIITASGTYRGETMDVVVDDGDTVYGNVLYQKADFSYARADADFSTLAPAYVMALEDGAGTKRVLLYGQIVYGSWNAGKVYLSTTTGELQQTVVSGSTDQIQVLGWALASGTLFFNPNYMVAEVE